MFITLSIVLERMRYEGVVDIFQTVKMLRTQRPAMVQTEVRGRPGPQVMARAPPSQDPGMGHRSGVPPPRRWGTGGPGQGRYSLKYSHPGRCNNIL